MNVAIRTGSSSSLPHRLKVFQAPPGALQRREGVALLLHNVPLRIAHRFTQVEDLGPLNIPFSDERLIVRV